MTTTTRLERKLRMADWGSERIRGVVLWHLGMQPRRAYTVVELARLAECAPLSVRSAIRPLVAKGIVSLSYADRPRERSTVLVELGENA